MADLGVDYVRRRCVCSPRRVSALSPLSHPSRTSTSPSALPTSPSLITVQALPPFCSHMLVLMDPAQSCHLKSDNFRRPSPARWRGAATSALGCKIGYRAGYHALPPMSSFKSWPTALILSLFFLPSSLPVYRALIILPIVSRHSVCS